MSGRNTVPRPRASAHSTAREMLLRLDASLYPSTFEELRAVLEDAAERENWTDPGDLAAERANWEQEAEEAAEEAKEKLDAEISRHNETREDLKNTEKDLSDLSKKYDELLETLADYRDAKTGAA